MVRREVRRLGTEPASWFRLEGAREGWFRGEVVSDYYLEGSWDLYSMYLQLDL